MTFNEEMIGLMAIIDTLDIDIEQASTLNKKIRTCIEVAVNEAVKEVRQTLEQ